MINKPAPFKDLNIRIPTRIPTKGRGFIDHGFGSGFRVEAPGEAILGGII